MQNLKNTLYLADAEDEVMDDEIDELFGQLEVIQPPDSLVGQILSSVAKLPPYPQMQMAANWKSSEGLIVHQEMLDPS